MLDLDRIAELRDEVGEEDFLDVAHMFLDEIEAALARLGQNPDAARLEADLHFLKGCALNLGFEELSALCDAGRRAAAGQTGAGVEIERIAAVYAESKAAFQAAVGGA